MDDELMGGVRGLLFGCAMILLGMAVPACAGPECRGGEERACECTDGEKGTMTCLEGERVWDHCRCRMAESRAAAERERQKAEEDRQLMLERARAELAEEQAKAAATDMDPRAFYRAWPLPEARGSSAGRMRIELSHREGYLEMDHAGAKWTSVTCGVDQSEEVVVPIVVSAAQRRQIREQVLRMRFFEYRMHPTCPWQSRGSSHDETQRATARLSVSIGKRSNEVFWRHQGYEDGACATPGDELAKLMRMLAEIVDAGIADAKLPKPKCGHL